jgi:hypothetical protein
MPLKCEIVPRPDARPDELTSLGVALGDWFTSYLSGLRAAGRDVGAWMDGGALMDLCSGELPQSWGRSCRDSWRGVGAATPSGTAQSRPDGTRDGRSVPFGLSLAEEEREPLLTSLRRALPMELVAEVRVNGLRAG